MFQVENLSLDADEAAFIAEMIQKQVEGRLSNGRGSSSAGVNGGAAHRVSSDGGLNVSGHITSGFDLSSPRLTLEHHGAPAVARAGHSGSESTQPGGSEAATAGMLGLAHLPSGQLSAFLALANQQEQRQSDGNAAGPIASSVTAKAETSNSDGSDTDPPVKQPTVFWEGEQEDEVPSCFF